MNSVSIDVDMLDNLPAKTLLKLMEKQQNAKKYSALYSHTLQQLSGMFRRFEELDIEPHFTFDDGDIDLQFSGDGERLRQVWGELRRNGYKTESRPKKGDTSFYARWTQEGFASVWISFSSTLCKRVQVGTELKEVPIYETQCGEMPGVEQLEAPEPAALEVF